MKEQCGTRRP